MDHSIASKFDRVCQILEHHQRNPHKLIPILQEIQAEYLYLPEEILTFVSTALGFPLLPSTVSRPFTHILP
jgi:NADH-quinone oxidoreductase subunit E